MSFHSEKDPMKLNKIGDRLRGNNYKSYVIKKLVYEYTKNSEIPNVKQKSK